jgi:RHS repeat-associated protein
MSNKSGISNQVISLPKGGGAQQGIGEKFSPDLFTGTGNFTVPIALPPGRNGFQPELSLAYSTGTSNGPLGLGWSWSIPGISRKTSQGIPRYRDHTADLQERDTFVLSSAEDLVPVEETATWTRYRPRTEGLFALIMHHEGADNDYWEVRSKDGLVSFYGTPKMAGHDPAVVADPTDRTKVFAWKLTLTNDPFGNRIEYDYERDSIQDRPRHWDQPYLKQIRYADFSDSGNTRFLVSVSFDYEPRPDPFSSYRAGFEIRTRKRCRRIKIKTHSDQERLVRTYDLVYLDERFDLDNLAQLLPLTGNSLLSQIKVAGHDGSAKQELPPLEFSYTQFEPRGRRFFPLEGADFPVRSVANPDLELADLFGNGLPDVLEMGGTVRYWRNLGDGRFDLPRPMTEAPAGLTLANPGVQLIDADGDGRIDLLTSSNGLSGYFPLRFGGLWDRRSFQRYLKAPSFGLEDPEVKLVDLDGDGITDAVRSGTRLECFFNDHKQGWTETRHVERRAIEDFPNINFSDPRVKWGDMSGDGLQDIVLVYDGNIEYWPNLGHGNWGKRIHMHNSPRFSYGYDPKRILIGDVDGDGLADISYIDDRKVTLWINQSGNGWSAPITIQGTPPVSDMDAVRLADMLGTGIGGVLWSKDADAPGRENYYFLDFTGGLKPYLLNEMNNHMGAVTRVEYRSSIEFYLEDQKRPETRWKTPLPFPVHVVADVETIDEISRGKLTTEYSYHHGYWDGAEREFRGFGRVDQRDTEVFGHYHTKGLHPDRSFEAVDSKMFSPPLETRTWFHQGPIGDEFGEWEETDFSGEFWSGDSQILSLPPSMENILKAFSRRAKRDALRSLRGRIMRTELYALDGSERQDHPYTVTEYLHGVREETPPGPGEEDRLRIFFPHTLAQRTTQWERGDDPMTQLSFTEDYDKYGQPRTENQIACPRGWQKLGDIPVKPYLATRSRTEYAKPDSNQCYIMDRVAKITTFEIKNDGNLTVPTLKDLPDDSGVIKVIGQTLNYYDGSAFQGLGFGQVGVHGALVRTETLILTEEILRDAYRSGDTVLEPPELPPYLGSSGPPNWTPEYPESFRNSLKSLAGYTFHPGGVNDEHARGYFATARQKYDFQNPQIQGRGLLTVSRDSLEHDTIIEYDSYDLLPIQITDPANLVTQTTYDYRVLQPEQITDPNGNRTRYSYTAQGLLKSTALLGKADVNEGDTDIVPGIKFEYAFLAYMNSSPHARQPISVRTIRRAHHVNDTDASLPERDQTIETVEYSDGFGRPIQIRTQAEDVKFGNSDFGDVGLATSQSEPNEDAIGSISGSQVNVVVSGWQIYDNKGRVVEKYESFFSCGWSYASPTENQKGQKAVMYYDPRGQVIRTENPDGSQQRIVYGIPTSLGDPAQFEPSPWEVYTYDENDNGGRTHYDETQSYQHHWNTPSSVETDALGRTIRSVERNGSDSDDWYTTESVYDIRGNLLSVRDALGREAFRYTYDLTPTNDEDEEDEGTRVLRIEQLDAGLRRIVFDPMGNEIERRDSKGALVLQASDAIARPLCLWARDNNNEAITLREYLVYGDSPDTGLSLGQIGAANLRGKLYKHYDEAGLLTFHSYDFKGNVLDKTRQVIGDTAILSVFSPSPSDWQIKPFRVDWQPPVGASLENHAGGLLDATLYQSSFAYDGLNRIKTMHFPQDVDGERKVLNPIYNRAGALESVMLGGTSYVKHIAYNAKGQRTLIVYGNSVMTRYAYDSKTFRLARMRTERYTAPTALTYHPTGSPLQDSAYEYDLVSNVLMISDRAPGSGVPNTASGKDALDRMFTYDPLCRLLTATGRECSTPPLAEPWDDVPKCHDVNLTRSYVETYAYDATGNVIQLKHTTGQESFTRNFSLISGNNRLQAITIGAKSYSYTYDANGNLSKENESRHFEWDYDDRMRVCQTQIVGAEPSVHTHYLYDSDGRRLIKFVRKQGGQYKVRVYIDGVFEHYRWKQTGANAEQSQNNHLHVMDDQQRIALIRIGEKHPDDKGPAIQYHVGDYLGSSNLVVNENGTWISREEFTPYGETSFGGFSQKRYRFTGKERDEESGLNYHDARYYAPWLARWVSCDPEGISDGLNVYLFLQANPVCRSDPTGTKSNITTEPMPREMVSRLEQGLGRKLKEGEIALYDPGGKGGYRGEITLKDWQKSGYKGKAYVYDPANMPSNRLSVLDWLTKLAGWLNLEFGSTGTGVQGGVPAGVGPRSGANRLAQIGYCLAAMFVSINPAQKQLLKKLAAKALSARARKAFKKWALKTITEAIEKKGYHPLRNLVKKTKGLRGKQIWKWRSGSHLSHEPAVHAGHKITRHSGAPERLGLEDAWFNELANYKGEMQGAIFDRGRFLDIGGVPVDYRTARMWESVGLIAKGIVKNAKSHAGWVYKP